jgi:hypothetical protein
MTASLSPAYWEGVRDASLLLLADLTEMRASQPARDRVLRVCLAAGVHANRPLRAGVESIIGSSGLRAQPTAGRRS